jgi:hypothetical protein
MKIDVTQDALLRALVEPIRDERDHGGALMRLMLRFVNEASKQGWFETHWRTDARLKLAQLACGDMPKDWRSAAMLDVIAEAARLALKTDQMDGEGQAVLLAIKRLVEVERTAESEPRPVNKPARRRKVNGAAKPASRKKAKARPAAKAASARKTRAAKPAATRKTSAAKVTKARAAKSATMRKAKATKARITKATKPAAKSATMRKANGAAKVAKARITKASKPAAKSATVRKASAAKVTKARVAKSAAMRKASAAAKATKARITKTAKPRAARKAAMPKSAMPKANGVLPAHQTSGTPASGM